MLHLALPHKINSVIKATKVFGIFIRRVSKDSIACDGRHE